MVLSDIVNINIISLSKYPGSFPKVNYTINDKYCLVEQLVLSLNSDITTGAWSTLFHPFGEELWIVCTLPVILLVNIVLLVKF